MRAGVPLAGRIVGGHGRLRAHGRAHATRRKRATLLLLSFLCAVSAGVVNSNPSPAPTRFRTTRHPGHSPPPHKGIRAAACSGRVPDNTSDARFFRQYQVRCAAVRERLAFLRLRFFFWLHLKGLECALEPSSARCASAGAGLCACVLARPRLVCHYVCSCVCV